MTQPNPFSMVNSLEHLVNTKINNGPTGGYEVNVDIANVDIYYGRQLGGPTGTQRIQQAYIRQIGEEGISGSGSAFFNQIGSTTSRGNAFFNQIGSTASRGDAYFNRIYWNFLDPAITGGGGSGATLLAGPGISVQQSGGGSQTISGNLQGINGIQVNTPVNGPITIGYNAPNIIGTTGIGVSFSNNIYTLTSNVGIVGSQYIGVTLAGSTYTISYLGSQGGIGGNISGISGSYAVFGPTGIQSSTVLNSTNIVGSTGRLMLYSPQGPTSSSLFRADIDGRTLVIPSTIITDPISYPTDSGYLRLTSDSSSGFIQPGNSRGGSSSLNISGPGNSPPSILTTFDISNRKVTINPSNLGGGVQSLGASSVSQTLYYGTSGTTYNIYLYGGGGAGLSGFGGGAGGFVQVSGITAGAGGITFSFNNQVNSSGGGNSLQLLVNGITAAIAPGGGGGGSRGVGAAYGEPGGSYNGQGFSAISGVTGGIGGIFASSQTNGTTGFNYKIGSTGLTAQSGIFNNIQITYGLTGFLSTGTKITGYGVIPNVHGTTFTTYYFPPGSTMIFETNGITFENSLYSFTGITYGVIDLSNINTTSLTGTTFGRQAVGGTATVDGSTYQFQDGYIGGTFSGDGSGIDQMLVGATFPIGLTGLTLTVNYGTLFTDFGITGGIQINFTGGLTFNFSRSLGSTIAPVLRVTDPIYISPNSIIQVETQTTISRGINGTIGGTYGGGAGFQGGGGGTGGGGGGAGLALISTGFTGITGAGSALIPYFGTYNLNGQYGFGGSGTTGGTPYYVVEQINVTAQPDVLQVNGNETVSGGLTISGKITGAGNNSVYASNDITSNSTINGSVITAYSNIPQGGLFRSYTTPGAAYVPINCPDGVFSGGQIFSVGNIIGNSGLTISPSILPAPGAGNIVASGTITGQDLIATSDRRLKTNIQTVDSALDKVSKLRGVYFTRNGSEKRNIGLIAQEIEEILPEVVYTDESPEQMKSVAYGNIIGLLIEAIKELKELKKNTK